MSEIVNGKSVETNDDITSSIVSIEVGHHKIHDGKMFYAEHHDAEMTDTDKIEMVLVTPNSDVRIHLIPGAGVTGEATLELFRDVVTTTPNGDGTVLTNDNRDENSSEEATLVVTHTPSISSDGDLRQTRYYGSTGLAGTATSGDDIRGVNERILEKNTKYLLRLTAHGNIKGRTYANWYEV